MSKLISFDEGEDPGALEDTLWMAEARPDSGNPSDEAHAFVASERAKGGVLWECQKCGCRELLPMGESPDSPSWAADSALPATCTETTVRLVLET